MCGFKYNTNNGYIWKQNYKYKLFSDWNPKYRCEMANVSLKSDRYMRLRWVCNPDNIEIKTKIWASIQIQIWGNVAC